MTDSEINRLIRFCTIYIVLSVRYIFPDVKDDYVFNYSLIISEVKKMMVYITDSEDWYLEQNSQKINEIISNMIDLMRDDFKSCIKDFELMDRDSVLEDSKAI